MRNVALLSECLEATHVNRMHVVYRSVDTVGRHSCGVALLCEYLLEGTASKALLMSALLHDLAELHTGDTPASAKWDSHQLKAALDELEARHYDRMVAPGGYNLDESEIAVLKLADLLELQYFCLMETTAGNLYARSVGERVEAAVARLWQENEARPKPHSRAVHLAFALSSAWSMRGAGDTRKGATCFC